MKQWMKELTKEGASEEMSELTNERPKGRFTRYDFVAYSKLTTGLRHDLGPTRQS